MRCNQRFFGQERFETGTAERDFCSSLSALRPRMSAYGFSVRDWLPMLPSDMAGLVQVKYNGMLSVITWDEKRGGFIAWSPKGRCYYSRGDKGKHPVTEYFNESLKEFRDHAFVGETYVVRKIHGKSYMTEFNKSMSIIKNPKSIEDVNRIQLAVFDYAKRGEKEFNRPAETYVNRFEHLRQDFMFPAGCDSSVVHLPDYLEVEGGFSDSYFEIQVFWNEFIGERGFEGLVMHTDSGGEYKIKFRDTLDAAIIAFRMTGKGRPVCKSCGARFDAFWLRKLAKKGMVKRTEWFDEKGRLLGEDGSWIRSRDMSSCPLCSGSITKTAGPILGAKIALMTSEGNFVDVADGAQLSLISPVLDLFEPIYEAEGYLWVKPEVVIEVCYQDLYVDRMRPVYQFKDNSYKKVGTKKAVSLRPYRSRLREDKTVNPNDLRLEQLSYFVNRARGIERKWQRAKSRKEGLLKYL